MAVERAARVVILGAAGRDFHNFNMLYRDDPRSEVVAFTAAQIPGIADRRYPALLAGQHYPDGIPILPETELEAICRAKAVTQVMFAYSDATHQTVMHLASRALACGADFLLAGPAATMLPSRRPVIAVCAVRTGCGKSQVTRYLSRRLSALGRRLAVLRHPMPYGDLERQRVQRFATYRDLTAAACTIEEREEYEPHLAVGNVVYAGIDYRAILERAETEADLILWDGGNNDFPFVRPDLLITLVDALRPDQTASHHPGEAVLRMADVAVVTKVDAAAPGDVARAVAGIAALNPRATILRGASPVALDDRTAVAGRRVLVVEDGPSITHGGMPHGAGYVAAAREGAQEIVDPRASAAPAIADVFRQYPHIGPVLPALGYGTAQLAALAETINRSSAEVVVSATPIDLAPLVKLDKPVVRARYQYEDAGEPTLGAFVHDFLKERGLL